MQSLRSLSQQVRSFADRLRGAAEDFPPLEAARHPSSTAPPSAAQSKLALLAAQLQALQQQEIPQDQRWQPLQTCLDLAEMVIVVSLLPEGVEPGRWLETLHKCFVAAAAALEVEEKEEQLGGVQDAVKKVAELVYIHDRATLGRVLLRVLVLEQPRTCVRMCERVIAGAAAEDQLVLRRADHDAQSLSQLQQLLSRFAAALTEKQASVRPLLDDVTVQIRHAHWYEASMPKPAALVVKVAGCGETEVCGSYRPDVSKSEPCYRSKSGNEIVRRVRRCGHGSQVIFMWHIRNPLTGSLFYGCISQRDTTIPPSAGWQSLSHGHEPAPSVRIESEGLRDQVSDAAVPSAEATAVVVEFPVAARRDPARATSHVAGSSPPTAAQTRRSQAVQLKEGCEIPVLDLPSAVESNEQPAAAEPALAGARLQDEAVAAAFQQQILCAANCGSSPSAHGDHIQKSETFRSVLKRRIAESQKIVELARNEPAEVVIAQALQRVPVDVRAHSEAAAESHSKSLATNPAMNLHMLVEAARVRQLQDEQQQRHAQQPAAAAATAAAATAAAVAEREGSDGGASASHQSSSGPEHKNSRSSDEDSMSWKPSLSLPEFVGFTKSMLASQKNRAEVLGATLFPAEDLERAAVQYVVQIALTEPAYRRERSSSFAEPKSSVAEYVASLVHIMEVQKNTKTRVFTLRRDLNAFTALHTDVQAALPNMDSKLLEFPDPFVIGETEEDYIRLVKSTFKATISRKNQGCPYTYSSPALKAQFYKSKNTPSLAAIHGQGVKPLQEGMQRLQHYLQGVLQLLETVDPCLGGHGPPELAEKIGAALGRFLVGDTPVARVCDADVTYSTTAERQQRASMEEQSAPTIRVSEGSNSSGSVEVCRPAWVPFSNGGGMEVFLQMQDTQGGKLSLRNEDQLLRAQNHRCFGCGERLVAGLFGLEKNFAPCRYFGRLFCRRWCHADDHRPIPHRILHSWDFQPHRVCRQAAQYLDSIAQNPVICVTFVNPRLFDDVPRMQAVRKYRAQLCSLVELVLDPPKDHPPPAAAPAPAAAGGGSDSGGDNEDDADDKGSRNTRNTGKRQMSIRPDDAAFQSARDIVQRQLGERLHLGVDTEMYSLEDLAAVKSGELLRTIKALIATLLRILPPAHLPHGLGTQDESPTEPDGEGQQQQEKEVEARAAEEKGERQL